MNRVNTSVVAALLAVMLAPAAWAEAPALPEVKAVTEHLDALYQAKSSHATMRMEAAAKCLTRTM